MDETDPPTISAEFVAGVRVKNVNTGLTQTVRTSSDGVFTILYLPVGDYTVSTGKAGVPQGETTGVRVNVAIKPRSRMYALV